MTLALSLEDLLGDKEALPAKPRPPLQWVSLIRQGIPSAAVDSLATTLAISQSELATALAIPDRTLTRRKKEGTLNSEESAKLLQLARVVKRADEVFGAIERALDWLKSPNAAWSGATPLSLLDTDIGTESVLDTPGRIEHGIFA